MPAQLTALVLIENTAADGLLSEHGLSIHLSYRQPNGRALRLLLDFGQTGAFARNASTLGVDLAQVDMAVLSHAHYDHADGMDAFFATNTQAPLYLSEACAEDCWSTKGGTAEAHYIGIRPGMLASYRGRLVPVPTDRMTTIADGIHLVPHTTPGLAKLGMRAGMLRRACDEWVADDFAHELTLVLELDGGRLAVFSSCSHAGLPTIIDEVAEVFPSWHVAAYVGGLHLVHANDEEVLAVSEAAHSAGVDRLYTGHCTGSHAYGLLAAELPDCLTQLHPGLALRLG